MMIKRPTEKLSDIPRTLNSIQSEPQEPNDFTGNVLLFERHGDNHRRFPGTLFEDFTNLRQRIDVDRHQSNGGVISIYRFFDKKREYDYVAHDDTCVARTMNHTMHAAFDWISKSHYAGDCHSRHNQGDVKGDLWRERGTAHNFWREVCVAQNSTQTPFWVEQHHGHRQSRIVEFLIFTKGTPSADVFKLPDICTAAIVEDN